MRSIRIAGGAWAALVVFFLLAPILVTVLVSFSATAIFDLPSTGGSLRWYEKLWSQRSFWAALRTSAWIAAASTAISLVLATLASLAIAAGKLPGGNAIATLLTSPLMLPGLVLGIAFLQAFRAVGLRDAETALVIAHVVITLPYIARTLLASLALFDFSLLDAAQTLGCTWAGAVRRVLLPVLFPAFLTGGTFAFLASLDNYSVSLFLVDATTKTLPIQVLNYLETGADPTIAAISTLLLGFTVIGLVLADRLVGLRRLQVV